MGRAGKATIMDWIGIDLNSKPIKFFTIMWHTITHQNFYRQYKSQRPEYKRALHKEAKESLLTLQLCPDLELFSTWLYVFLRGKEKNWGGEWGRNMGIWHFHSKLPK